MNGTFTSKTKADEKVNGTVTLMQKWTQKLSLNVRKNIR